MRRKLALLGFLMLISVGTAYAVNALDDLQILRIPPTESKFIVDEKAIEVVTYPSKE